MKTLVLKCKESVNNTSLRGMNEVRIKLTKRGDGSGVILINRIRTTNYSGDVLPDWYILSGTGHFTNSVGTTDLGQHRTGELAYIKISTDVVVQIRNFDISCDCLGLPNNALSSVASGQTANAPLDYIDLYELNGKSTIECVNVHSTIAGDLKYIKDCTSLKVIKSENRTNAITGDFSNIPDSLESFEALELNLANAGSSINWSLSDVTNKTNLKRVVLSGQNCSGGDIYDLLASKQGTVFFAFSKCGTSVPITCHYVSGTSEIPTIDIANFTTYQTGKLEKADTLAFLNLIKDGMDASKITVSASAISIDSKSPSDPDVTALKNTLAGSPYNVTINVR